MNRTSFQITTELYILSLYYKYLKVMFTIHNEQMLMYALNLNQVLASFFKIIEYVLILQNVI